MITALDSSVLLDVVFNDPKFLASSLTAITAARRTGQLIVCDAVIVELAPTLAGRDSVERFMQDLGATFIPMSLESCKQAGDYFHRYLQKGGKRGRVAADFMIGGHARVHADQLLTRDSGFYRTHFRGLKVVTPK